MYGLSDTPAGSLFSKKIFRVAMRLFSHRLLVSKTLLAAKTTLLKVGAHVKMNSCFSPLPRYFSSLKISNEHDEGEFPRS